MPVPLKAGLPPDLVLSAGYVVRLTALDPATGSTVSGVRLTDISVFVTDVGDTSTRGDTDAPMPLLVPSDELG